MKTIAYALLGLTMVTGLVDAVAFLSLGRVFTANMTGNVVILAFATARIPGLSIAYSLTALLSFLVGAIFGGRIMARASACWKTSFSLLHRCAPLDTDATCWSALFSRLL